MSVAGVWQLQPEVFGPETGPEGRGQDTPTTAPSCSSKTHILQENIDQTPESMMPLYSTIQPTKRHTIIHTPTTTTQPTFCVSGANSHPHNQQPLTHQTVPARGPPPH